MCKLLPWIFNSPLCHSSIWGDLHYFYSKARLFIKIICSRWDWIWVLTPVYTMLSHSVFLGAGESHLLVLLSTSGFEKLLSWMKCLCLVHLISFTKWVSEAHVGKVDILSLYAVHLCLLSSQRNWQGYDKLLVSSSWFSWSILQDLSNGFGFLLQYFLLVTFVFFSISKQTQSLVLTWYFFNTDMILHVLRKVGLKPGLIGKREEE